MTGHETHEFREEDGPNVIKADVEHPGHRGGDKSIADGVEDRPREIDLWRHPSVRIGVGVGVAGLLGLLGGGGRVLGSLIEGDGFIGIKFRLGGEVEWVTE